MSLPPLLLLLLPSPSSLSFFSPLLSSPPNLFLSFPISLEPSPFLSIFSPLSPPPSTQTHSPLSSLQSAYLFHVVASLCASLNKHDVQILCLSLSLLHRDLPLVLQVRLVPNQHNDDIIASLGTHVFDPLIHLLERVGICVGKNGSHTHTHVQERLFLVTVFGGSEIAAIPVHPHSSPALFSTNVYPISHSQDF